jgi:hypothetical protein
MAEKRDKPPPPVFFPLLKKAFDMFFFRKSVYGVFELPLLRNAQKRHLKQKVQSKYKKERHLPRFHLVSGYLPDVRRFQFFFLRRPLVRAN